MSWYDAWADRYDERSAGAAADAAFYVGLAREAAGPVVELAVGTGRVDESRECVFVVRR